MRGEGSCNAVIAVIFAMGESFPSLCNARVGERLREPVIASILITQPISKLRGSLSLSNQRARPNDP